MTSKKNLTIIAATVILLTGCATNQQAGEAVGAIAGGIIGNQVGGGAGRAAATVIGAGVGASVGAAVGRDMDERERERRDRHAYPPAPIYDVSRYPQCDRYHYGTTERSACERGARQREIEEQRRREAEAYRRGRGY